MSFSKLIEAGFRKFIPAPFTLAVLLSLFTIIIAFLFTGEKNLYNLSSILKYWQDGMWEPTLLVFAVQMMLILVLGHVLVLSRPVSWLTERLTNMVSSNQSAVILVSFSTMVVAFFNWGLGLIFGAILARKVGEASQKKGFKINYPLIGAAGYSGLMVWHGGISGSAPLKAAEPGHLFNMFENSGLNTVPNALPDNIPTATTIFSQWNLIIFLVVLLVIPATLWYISKRTTITPTELPIEKTSENRIIIKGAEKLDHSPIFKTGFGILLLLAFCISYSSNLSEGNLTPNMLNFFMLGLCILLHKSFAAFLKAMEEAIGGAAAILIQFPLYFGVIGIMKHTGLVSVIAGFFTSIATDFSLPVFTFFSAGLVNIFVPSGGGQWAIQGPIVLESALKLGIPLNKMIMAFAYGDQVTNMLQPFWALPLLAITRLKAKEILPYTLIMMLIGTIVYISGLLLL